MTLTKPLTECSYRELSYVLTHQPEKTDLVKQLADQRMIELNFQLSTDHTPLKIRTLTDLLPVPEIEPEVAKILALDLDEVLMTAHSVINSNRWHAWMEDQHSAHENPRLSHAQIASLFWERAPKRHVEPQALIHRVITEYKAQGWHTVILTARPIWAKEFTQEHLEELQIPHDALIMRDTNNPSKSSSLLQWMNKQPWYTPALPAHIRFTDDKIFQCKDVYTLNWLEGITAHCYEFTPLEDPIWSSNERKNAVIQFHAYLKGLPIPPPQEAIDESSLQSAMSELNLKDLGDESLYNLFINPPLHVR